MRTSHCALQLSNYYRVDMMRIVCYASSVLFLGVMVKRNVGQQIHFLSVNYNEGSLLCDL